MGSARKHDRVRGKDKYKATSVQPSPFIPKVTGCPMPASLSCIVGQPVPQGEDGVKMECSNERCPYANVLLHQECFDALEDHLVKILSNLGSARGWTDAQRRANLWEKKGQSLVAKVCRCRCGLGMTKLDKLAADDRLKRKAREEAEAQREAALAAGLRTPPQKKKHKNRNGLPRLNFGGPVKPPPPPKIYTEDRESQITSRQQTAGHRDVSSSSFSSTLTSQQSRRESSTYASDAWGLLPSLPTYHKAQSVMSGHFADQDDSISTSSKEYASAPSNSITMSYATAMKNGTVSSYEHSHMSPNQFVTTPLSVRTDMLVSDSGVESKSRSTTSSEFSELASYKDLLSPMKEEMMTTESLPSLGTGCTDDELLTANLVDVECFSREPYMQLDFRRSSLPASLHGATLYPFAECSYTNFINSNPITTPEWHLFSGSSFSLGESIIANTFLPIWRSNKSSKLRYSYNSPVSSLNTVTI